MTETPDRAGHGAAIVPAQAGTDAREGVATGRVRVGAIGLACVFLLVMLATALLHATGEGDIANGADGPGANMAMPAEPLAQLGVAPGNAPPDPVPAQPRASARRLPR